MSTIDSSSPNAVQDFFDLSAERAFCHRHGYRRWEGANKVNWCAHLLHRRSCSLVQGPCRIPSPISDHVRVYKSRRGYPVIVSQPYCAPERYAELTAVAADFAKQWGLFFRIANEESWWNTGRTILIELWGKGAQR